MNKDLNSTPRVEMLSNEYVTMVMLVDDQPMVGEAVRRKLGGEGDIDFHFCYKPQAAVELALQIKPTIILQDLVMPGVAGLDLVRQYRAHPALRDVPVIVLSSAEEPTVKSEAFAAGADDYLVKLPDKIELLARVRYHSKSYLNQLQRDAAFKALQESQRQLQRSNTALVAANQELQKAVLQVESLESLLPVCRSCGEIRSDRDYIQRVECYFATNETASSSDALCSVCLSRSSTARNHKP